MSSKGPIRVPDAEPENIRNARPPDGPDEILLPDAVVIGAGLAKFREMAKLYWPQRTAMGLVNFDLNNSSQLGTVLGLVYMAMRDADR